MKNSLSFLILILVAISAQATSTKSKQGTVSEMERALKFNSAIQGYRKFDIGSPKRPVTDFHKFKYLLMSNLESFNSTEFKKSISQNLPEDMTLVLLVTPGAEESTLARYTQWISPERLIIATHSTADEGFWSRDSYPFPVFMDNQGTVNLVSAKYFRDFQGAEVLARTVNGQLRNESHVFVGGNLLADESGRCIVVASPRLFGLTDSTLQSSYGCREVIRLRHLAGIGDVDEVIKLLPGGHVLSSLEEYEEQLKDLGYKVTLLPRLTNYRTYANSVILNGIVIMPAFNLSTDDEAVSVYESFGYKVVKANSETISTQGLGSFHCTTMAYPDLEITDLMRSIGAEIFF